MMESSPDLFPMMGEEGAQNSQSNHVEGQMNVLEGYELKTMQDIEIAEDREFKMEDGEIPDVNPGLEPPSSPKSPKRSEEDTLALILDLDTRLRMLENWVKQDGPKRGESPKTISKSALMDMIVLVIKDGNERYGVNRSFIRKVLGDKFKIPNSSYWIKRVNQMLQLGLEQRLLEYDPSHQLFTVA